MQKRVFATMIVALALGGCNGTEGELAATTARPDRAGMSSMAVDDGRSIAPESDDPSGDFDLGRIAPRLSDVAQGRTGRPNFAALVDGRMNGAMAMQHLALASAVAQAAVGAAVTGGASLAASAPGLAMQAASTGIATAEMSAAKGQVRSALAEAEAQRAAARIVPQADRPAEARAILSVLEGPGGRSAAWRNPETGASGRVTVQPLRGAAMPEGLQCSLVRQEWKGGSGTRRGSMIACRQNGVWYDLS